MTDSATFLSLIEEDIHAIEKAMVADVASCKDTLDPLLLEILNYGLFSGGKRLRPLLAVVSSRLCRGGGGDVYNLAMSFEYLHLATLFHDDVIDQADLRRGRPSVSKAFGLEAAILTGDFLHARSMAMIGRYGGTEALEVFCNATEKMVDGEFLQLRNSENYNMSEEDYFAAIQGKTAVLIAATTEIGAIHGGADKNEQVALREYGSNLGYGFQIIDDLLDYQGDQSKTGKVVGNDLAERKMTLPLILTMRAADPHDSSILLDILSNPEKSKNSFDTVYNLIEKYNGFEMARQKAVSCINEALKQLEIFPQEKKKDKYILTALAQYVLNRDK